MILIVDDSPFNVQSLQMMIQYCLNIECDTVSLYYKLKLFRLTQG